MDKYEEAAKGYYDFNGEETLDGWAPLRPAAWRLIFEMAFRWYDEQREKEVCEWTYCKGDYKSEVFWKRRSYWETCGEPFDIADNAIFQKHQVEHYRCPNCGRRIVEVK